VRFDRLYFLDDLSDIAPRHLQVVVILQIKPKMRRRTERLAQAESRVRCDTHILRCDALNARSRNAHLASQRAGRQLERNEKLLTDNFTGMHGREFFGHRRPIVAAIKVRDTGTARAFGQIKVVTDQVFDYGLMQIITTATTIRDPVTFITPHNRTCRHIGRHIAG
jgi:hypothetical protein